MVALGSRLEAIKAIIEAGEYFSINRARQYGKTTILRALASFLKKDYEVVSGVKEIQVGDKVLIEAVV